jgi:ubiquinone/menaquinone biosynthesis C-methylase UbiE
MPVMLRGDVAATIDVAGASLDVATALARGAPTADPPPYLTTIGLTEEERAAAKAAPPVAGDYEPVVAAMILATSGNAYRHLVGRSMARYPIPAFRFPTPRPGRLLDVGCNWGRWTVAAARAGHDAVGIDPQLGSVLAARRVAARLGVNARFVVGDGRYLPFRAESVDYVWSYSVLQHFSPRDARAALAEMRRVLRPRGIARVQMANALGLRSIQQMARRNFREPTAFEVRYWRPAELRAAFSGIIGATTLDADCYLGLGLQWSDYDHMTGVGKAALVVSETLRRMSVVLPPLRLVADSVFCTSRVAG